MVLDIVSFGACGDLMIMEMMSAGNQSFLSRFTCAFSFFLGCVSRSSIIFFLTEMMAFRLEGLTLTPGGGT